MAKYFDAIIIGGGFFGTHIATNLPKSYKRILIIEKGDDFLQRASYNNQARVHNGYHYPRSFLTAVRSRINYPVFISDYPGCVDHNYDHYYAIGKNLSKVTTSQYLSFCKQTGLETKRAPEKVRALFDFDRVEDVFRVKECVFDAVKLKKIILQRIVKRGIKFELSAEVKKVKMANNGYINVTYLKNKMLHDVFGKEVFNCTYSELNKINHNSHLATLDLKHEITEMALLDVPEDLKKIAITLMCGPFFSLMPFPSRNLHCLSHVRYTPHTEWYDKFGDKNYKDPDSIFRKYNKSTLYNHMVRDASKYLPILSESKYVDSIWEVKTVLPESEFDDGRPILYVKNHCIKNYTCIMGGKIDNVYDILKEINGK